MGAHARLSPSASAIWLNCPGQPRLAQGMSSPENEHMRRGTAAHALLEYCWKKPANPNPVVCASFEVSHQLKFTDEDRTAVQDALDWLRGEREEGDEVETEARLRFNDDLWGTCDWARYRPSTGELLVVDYKHGSGVAVEAVDNPQGVCYALMKARSLGNRGISIIRFAIIQPRCFHEDGPIREFTIEGADLLDWQARIEDAIEATHQPDAPLATGKWCRWCPAAGICPQARADALADAQATFTSVEVYDPAALADTLGKLPRIEAWIKAVREFAYGEAERGVKLPGWKLVPKRPVAKWRDPATVVQTLEMMGYDAEACMSAPELRSPAQVRDEVLAPQCEGATKKAREAAAAALLANLTEKVSSGHNLAPESDSRQPVRADATEDFAPVD